MDNDMSGGKTGAVYDYGFRIYDARIAKFLSVDPLTKSYPELTPYQFASNTPIMGSDLDGLELNIEIFGPADAADVEDSYQKALNSDDVEGNMELVLGLVKAYTFTHYDDKGWAAKESFVYDGSFDGTQVWHNNKMIANFPNDRPFMGFPQKNYNGFNPYSQPMSKADKMIASYYQFKLFGQITSITTSVMIPFAAPESILSTSSTTLMISKATIDFTGQMIFNKGNIRELDLLDLGLNTFTTPFFASSFGAAWDVKPFSSGDKIRLAGANKSYAHYGIDFATKFGFKTLKGSTLNYIKANPGSSSFSSMDLNLIDMGLSVPASYSGKGINRALKIGLKND